MTNALHIESYGQGKTVVLLHGWAMHAGMLRPFAQRLAQHRRVVCVDLPGHGRSALQYPFTLQGVAAELLAVLDETPCCWIGWSLGALVALEVARQSPGSVSELILVAGSPCFVQNTDWPGMDGSVLDAFAQSLLVNPTETLARFMVLQVQGILHNKTLLRALKVAAKECEVPGPEVLHAGLLTLKHQDLRSVFATMQCPVLVLLGSDDTLVPVAVASSMQYLLNTLQVVIIEKAGHVLFLSHPEAVAQAINDFLNGS